MAGTLPLPDFHADPQDRADLRRRRRGGLAGTAIVLALAGAAAWYWWPREQPVPPAPAPAAAVQPAAPVPDAAPAVQYPLPPVSEAEAVPPAGIAAAVEQLLGPGASYLVGDDLARRIVATIDQLGREHAPPSVWPVKTAPDRFLVEQRGEATVIAAENARRYAPMVDALASVDPHAIASLYRRLYPVLDRAWRDLGMRKVYLNDRVIAVLDLLLQTPEPQEPPAVRLTEVKGPVPSTRPWVRYEYADPAFEGLAAGQKILLRLDAPERQKVRDLLRALRRDLVQGR